MQLKYTITGYLDIKDRQEAASECLDVPEGQNATDEQVLNQERKLMHEDPDCLILGDLKQRQIQIDLIADCN